MDKELLKLYTEYEKYNKELPNLRNEYNFLIEDIDKKNKEKDGIEKSISSNKDVISKEIIELSKKREEFEFYKQGIENKLNIELKQKEQEINKLINQEIKEKKELEDKINEHNNLLVSFNKQKEQENERINKENIKMDERIRDLDSKTQLLSL